MQFSSRNGLIGFAALCSAAYLAFAVDVSSEIKSDAQLHAMTDEIARSKTLQLNSLDKPYFVSYSVSEADQFVVSGSLGGIVGSIRNRARHPSVQVRVGSYALDNTNSTFSPTPRLGLLPIDDDYDAIRTSFWLSTDGLYKAAADQITRKRNALRERADTESVADFAPATPAQLILPPSKLTLDQNEWENKIRRLSGAFAKYPDVASSSVRLMALATTYRLANSEGTLIRMPQDIADLQIRASGLAPDGSPVWNHRFLTTFRPSDLPSDEQLAREVEAIASETNALERAPLAAEYSGPVLFEQEAAAQMIAEVMADAARLRRKPVAQPDSNEGGFLESVWASRLGTKVTPDWMTMIDDPSQKQFQGARLAGYYPADDEGVIPKAVTLVEKGVLKAFLLSREPVKSFDSSNGHGRLPGRYGSEAATIGNLFVQVDQTTPESQMKARLIEKVKAAGLKYGILLRRLDFPSTANVEELQGMARQLQKSGYARTLSAPLLAYRVYPDGREELVRGLRFKEFSAKDLRDVALASDRPYVLNYLNNGSSFDFADVLSDATTSSVICPSLLFDSVDLDRSQDDLTKPPLVPPPPLTAQK